MLSGPVNKNRDLATQAQARRLKSRFCAHWSLPEGRYVGLKKLGVSIPENGRFATWSYKKNGANRGVRAN